LQSKAAPASRMMREIDQIFDGLSKSPFRQRFYLASRERQYLGIKGLSTVMTHARDFIDKRLAPANPLNDGKQTRFAGIRYLSHNMQRLPVVAAACQMAIPPDHALNGEERDHVLAVLERWIRREMSKSQVASEGDNSVDNREQR
jgi:hypothetical protein